MEAHAWHHPDINQGREIVFAIAIGCVTPTGAILSSRRSASTDEFKSALSIFTFSVTEKHFVEVVEGHGFDPSVAETVVARKSYPAEIFANCRSWAFERFGIRDRNTYLLVMGLVRLELDEREAKTLASRSSSLSLLSPAEFISHSGLGVGTCTSLLFRSLVSAGELPATAHYLEIPPELSGRAAEEVKLLGNSVLWPLASANYFLFRQGLSGSDSGAILGLLDDEVAEIAKAACRGECSDWTALDYGANRSSPLSTRLVNEGFRYASFDPYVSGAVGEAYSTHGKTLAFLVNVLQWLSDDEVRNALSAIGESSDHDVKAIIALPCPEFYKNGDWVGDPCDGNWMVSRPINREASLEMIGGVVGPLLLHHRSTADYVNLFSSVNWRTVKIHNLPSRRDQHHRDNGSWPLRHQKVPAFSVFELEHQGLE